MHQILVYADSLSWRIIPSTRNRFRFEQRWPGVMELELALMGQSVRVIEDCLNGRRTIWNDPFKPGRIGIGLLIERNNQHGGGIGLGLGGAIAINLFLALFFTAGDLRLYLS